MPPRASRRRNRSRPLLRSIALILVGALVAAACSGGGDDIAEVAPTPTATPVPPTPEPAPTPFPTVDDTPDAQPGVEGDAAGLVEQFVAWFNGEPLSEADYEATFADVFRAAVPYEVFTPGLDQMSAMGPWAVDRTDFASPTAQRVVVVNDRGNAAVALELSVDADGLIDSALLSPTSVEPPAPIVGFAETAAALGEFGTLRYLIAAPNQGECNTLANQAETELMPLASLFKLYVLGAIVEAVADGSVAWDDVVVIRDELDSVPTGITQDEEPGTQFSVLELAQRMIEISDNTATDHLIDLLGRDAVEAAVATLGHATPDALQPLLTTREFTIVKFGEDIELVEDYLAADTAERRALLDGVVADAPLPTVEDVVARAAVPVLPSEVGWFASPLDICNALNWLIEDNVALSILRRGAAAPNPDLWSDLGFKGGGEAGVLTAGWYMESLAGDPFIVVVGLVNEDQLIDDIGAFGQMVVLRDATLTLAAG